MRASFDGDLDNGWVFIPQFGYYRMSDKETDEEGSTSRYGLEVRYELTDSWVLLANATWQPLAVGYEGVAYEGGLRYQPFYYWAGLKKPWVGVKWGQSRTHSYVDMTGQDLPGGAFKQVGTTAEVEAETEAKNFHLQATWQKVIKYSSRPPQDVTFSWAEVPYMTAVLQGFIKDSLAAKISYQTQLITPYVSWVRYHYDWHRTVAAAISAGVHVQLWGAEVTGGVEIFEPRHDRNRKTFFSLSVDVPL